MRSQMSKMASYKRCMRNEVLRDHQCGADPLTGRLIEWEHAWIYAGKQVNEIWAIISICWWAHRGPGLDKEKNQFVSLIRATDEELEKYPRKDWAQIKKYLTGKYKAYDK